MTVGTARWSRWGIMSPLLLPSSEFGVRRSTSPGEGSPANLGAEMKPGEAANALVRLAGFDG